MAAKLASFLVWLIAAASAVHWGMKLFVQAPGAPAQAELVSAQPAARADLTRVLGVEAPVVVAAAAPVPADARFRLIGVVTPRSGSAPAVALIAVGDKPPRAYRVGAVVDGEHVLQDVQARGASLGPAGGAAKVSLALPAAPSRQGQASPVPAAPAPFVPYAAPAPVMPQAPNPSNVPEVMPPMQVAPGLMGAAGAVPALAGPAPAAAPAAAPSVTPEDDPDAEGNGRTRRQPFPRSGGAVLR